MSKRQKKKQFKRQFGFNPPRNFSIQKATQIMKYKKSIIDLFKKLKKVILNLCERIKKPVLEFIKRLKEIRMKFIIEQKRIKRY